MLDGLNAAHKFGIVHRDVKPGNVLLTEDDRVLLADFGIARRSGDSSMTGTGMLIGSLEYMAPERMRGADDDPVNDLFSLGATLYHLVTGRSPYRRESSAASMSAVLTYAPPPPGPSGPLTSVIMALLAKNPADRPSAAQAMTLFAPSEPSLPGPRPVRPATPAPTVSSTPTATAPGTLPARLARTIRAHGTPRQCGDRVNCSGFDPVAIGLQRPCGFGLCGGARVARAQLGGARAGPGT